MSQWSEGMELMGRRLVGERYESVVCEERRKRKEMLREGDSLI